MASNGADDTSDGPSSRGTPTTQSSNKLGPPKPSGPKPALSPGTSQRSAANNAAGTKEIEDLKTKLRMMEKKRAEDREKLKTLEQLQSERDKFEGIIQKLQTKYQPQQLEIGDLRKQLKEAEGRLEEAERLQAEHDSILEMAAVDREMAEETAEAIRTEFEALKVKAEELELEVDVLREENEELGQVMSPEEKSSQGWLQLERSNERLREALMRLRDMTQQQEADLRSQVKELEEDLAEYGSVKAQYEATKEKLLVSESHIEDLKQQLDTAHGAEEMIEELAEKNMQHKEEINELKAVIEDLESLKELNDELEINHVETEKQLQEEIDFRESIYNEQTRKVAQQDETIGDLEYTLTRFRELVSNLQGDLEDMRASQQITETEANDLTVKSRAMMDLNMKLQSSVTKAQVKTIDVELGRMESEESAQHLSIVKMYLPEYFDEERTPILAFLRFKRVSFKATIMHGIIKERIADLASAAVGPDDIFTAYGALEKLTWISLLCDRFVNFVSGCSVEEFATFEGALYELEPVERTLNSWIESLKKNEFNEKKCSVELQRSIALLSHLAETLMPPSVEAYADELCMRATLMQAYLENAASSLSHLKALLQAKLPPVGEDDEEGPFMFQKIDTLATQARGAKVVTGKIARSLDELKSRSLALSDDTGPSFEKAERATKDLSEFARQLGENILELTNEEGRVEPFTYAEISSNMSQTTTLLFQPSGVDKESSDALSYFLTKIRTLGTYLEDLSSVSTDLSKVTEFERHPSPWIARSKELKSNKTVSPDADEEIQRLKNEIHEVSTALGVKDKSLEEQSIKIELLESRMRDAGKKATLARELETKFEEVSGRERELVEVVEKQSRDLQAMESERDDFRARFEKAKRASGTSRDTAGGKGATFLDNEASMATARENEALRKEIASLQASVRFLRDDNRRAHLLDPNSVQRANNMRSWLDTPLVKPKVREDRTAAECQDVLNHLLRLSKESHVVDLKSSVPQEGASRLSWRPVKSTSRYHVLKQREDLERWNEWKDDVTRRERERERKDAVKNRRAHSVRKVSTQREQQQQERPPTQLQNGSSVITEPHSRPSLTPSKSQGMMGRAWKILGMQSDDDFEGNLDHSVEIV